MIIFKMTGRYYDDERKKKFEEVKRMKIYMPHGTKFFQSLFSGSRLKEAVMPRGIKRSIT